MKTKIDRAYTAYRCTDVGAYCHRLGTVARGYPKGGQQRPRQVVGQHVDVSATAGDDTHLDAAGTAAEMEVFVGGGVAVGDAAETLLMGAGLHHAHTAGEIAGALGVHHGEGTQWLRGTLRGHLHLADGAVGVEVDGLHAGLAKAYTAVGGAVVEHIPLTVFLHYRTVVVPYVGVTAEIVDYHAFVFVGAFQTVRHRVADAGGHAAATDVGVDKVVVPVVFQGLDAFVEVVVALGDDTVEQTALIDGFQIGSHTRHLGGELPPEEVDGAVVVLKDRGIYLVGMKQTAATVEGTRRTAALGQAFSTVAAVLAVEQVVAVAHAQTVGGIEQLVVVRHFVAGSFRGEDVGMKGPGLQVTGRPDVVMVRTVVVGTLVAAAVYIQPPAALPLVGRGVGKILAGTYNGVLGRDAEGEREQKRYSEIPYVPHYHVLVECDALGLTALTGEVVMTGMVAEGVGSMKRQIAEGQVTARKNAEQLVVVSLYVALLAGMAAVLDIEHSPSARVKGSWGLFTFSIMVFSPL